uniref:Uncharacterized protein n=1 Tax=viral metagenome TaxID=1070528 RepID=A0A6H1ZYI8_9ZZZZ
MDNTTSTMSADLKIEKDNRKGPFGKMIKREEFDDFKQSMDDFQIKVLDILEKLSETKNLECQPTPSTDSNYTTSISTLSNSGAVDEAIKEERAVYKEDDQSIMPARYQKIVDEIFDPTDGFQARLKFPDVDDLGQETGGIMFTVVVPDKFSNMTPAHKTMYKVDIRSIALQPNNIAKGIAEWCKRVAKNINYNILLKTK